MVNKRLLELAERQRNPSLPPEKKQPKLTQILERDENGKPKLTLNELEKTAVHTPTQEEYNTLMQVYECGDWRGNSGNLPTQTFNWNRYKGEICIRAEDGFGYDREGYYREREYQVISTQEFYDKQKILPEMIDEINKWFEHGK